MEYGGRGGGRPVGAPFLHELPAVDHMGQVAGEYRDPFRALKLLGELDQKVTKESIMLMPFLMSFVNHDAAVVIRQSIVSGTGFFCAVLEEIALQLRTSGLLDRWVEDIWTWMLKFKDAVCTVASKPVPVSTKAVAVKFLEVFILMFTMEGNDYERPFNEGNFGSIDISKLVGKHPILDPMMLSFEVKQCLDLLLDLLKCAGTLCGSLTVVVINCLAAIGRKRPVHYGAILSSLLGFDPDFGFPRGAHAASIRYSLRNAFLGFLRCMHHPCFAESRDKLFWALQRMNPGESEDQIIRQVDKMSKNMERVYRDSRIIKDDISASQLAPSGDLVMKKLVQTNDDPSVTDEVPTKRMRLNVPFNSNSHTVDPAQDDAEDGNVENRFSSKMSLMDSNSNAVEQMIAMIGAMLAEGERGAESLEILISQIQPELLADIVMANMKHLSSGPLPLSNKTGNMPNASQTSSSAVSTSVIVSDAAEISTFPSSGFSSQIASASVGTTGIPTSAEASTSPNLAVDFKRDPRRDPRRLDPRRAITSGGAELVPPIIDGNVHSVLDNSQSRPISDSVEKKVEISSISLTSKQDSVLPESSAAPAPVLDQLTSQDNFIVLNEVAEVGPSLDIHTSSDLALSPVEVDQDMRESTPSEITMNESFDSDVLESDHYSSSVSGTLEAEQTSQDLPSVPLYLELTDEETKLLSKSATLRVVEDYKPLNAVCDPRLPLLARLVAQATNEDEIILMLQKHIILNYQHQKGHELAMHVLYHLHSIMTSESDDCNSSFACIIYEKFLLALAKSLRDSLPASDKSFSKLLGEVPLLPDSALKLLEDLCHSSSDQHGKDTCDGDRVTQGLGTVWSMILVRPNARQACLDIALKCAIHPQDEVRAKAIRLVANKLYLLSYASEDIEQFAKTKLLSLVDKPVQDVKLPSAVIGEQRTEVGSQDTYVSGSQNSETGASESDSTRGTRHAAQSISNVSSSQAQRYTSLFFALCTKKTSLLQVVFDVYGRASKAVKQSVHRHVPILIRNLGTSYSNLLRIISDPPEGSEKLLMLVLQILTEEMTPSPDLIATVKHLYETKLKDAAILIPMLSSLSKDEVLPIFPRLVDLSMEKFQTALARILEGSAHTGPALTPAEVLVAIHNIDPEKDGIPLKKIMETCTACFEQRTVFTQQVLAKSLNHLVDQIPLPLLFMRTVIQAIDAFPTLVDFVMEILSKLVAKQIWKMPKLWVGFLKCASQTQPHSFNVLLQLPPPQLEFFLNRHASLRAPLSAHASQTSTRNSLPRSILAILGIVNEQQQPSHSVLPTSLRASDASSSVHGAALT